jgi:hypothetical protein
MTRQFHPYALAELTDAAQFYEAAAPGLGTDFLDEVERVDFRTVWYMRPRPIR